MDEFGRHAIKFLEKEMLIHNAGSKPASEYPNKVRMCSQVNRLLLRCVISSCRFSISREE